MLLCLYGKILCIHIINKVFYLRCHLLRIASPHPCIKAVSNRNEADAQKREYFLNIIPRFQIVPAKPGKVFDHHAVNVTKPYILHKPLELITVEVASCFPQVNIAVCNLYPLCPFPVKIFDIFFRNLHLHFDRFILFLVLIG